MPFSVEFTRRAYRDLDDQLSWWGHQNRTAAERWREQFLDTVLKELESHPNRFPHADEAADLGRDIRVLAYGRRRQVYRVLFTIDGSRVIVHRVRHTAQDRLTENDI